AQATEPRHGGLKRHGSLGPGSWSQRLGEHPVDSRKHCNSAWYEPCCRPHGLQFGKGRTMPDSVSSVLSGLSLQAAVSRVLVVDDDPDLLAVSQKVLTKAGYEVHSAEDGADAIERLDRTDFDLVVSDVDMPRIDGVQLLKTVRDTERHTPFIFITGNPRLETAIFAVNHGVVYYL